MKQYNQIDFNNIPLLNVILDSRAGAPSSPVEGQMWHDTANKQLKVFLNGGWVQCDNISTGLASNVSDGDKGDIVVGAPLGATGVWTIDTGVVTSAKIADGTITSTDLNTSSVRLDTIGAPTGAVSMNSQLLTNLAAPVSNNDAATKQYVDNAIQGLDAKQSVKFATTANIGTPTSAAPSSIDGNSVNVGDRILVKNQTNAAENGIYDVVTVGTGANGVWARSQDMNIWAESVSAFVFVEAGTVNSDTGWVATGNQSGTIGTTPMPWVQFSGAGAYTAGNGLTLTGTDFSVNVDGSSIEINTDILRVKAGGITNAMLAGSIDLSTKVTGLLPVANGGTNASTAAGARANLSAITFQRVLLPALSPGSYTSVSHALQGTDMHVQFFDASTSEEVGLDFKIPSAGAVQVRSAVTVNVNTIFMIVSAI